MSREGMIIGVFDKFSKKERRKSGDFFGDENFNLFCGEDFVGNWIGEATQESKKEVRTVKLHGLQLRNGDHRLFVIVGAEKCLLLSP